jgi:hypothetical protein
MEPIVAVPHSIASEKLEEDEARAQDFFARMRQRIEGLAEGVASLREFRDSVAHGIETQHFDAEDLSKVDAVLKTAEAELKCWRECHDEKQGILETFLHPFHRLTQERFQILCEQDSRTRVLGDHPELKNYFVEKQRQLEHALQSGMSGVLGWEKVEAAVRAKVTEALQH